MYILVKFLSNNYLTHELVECLSNYSPNRIHKRADSSINLLNYIYYE